jgi:hypothetical protein
VSPFWRGRDLAPPSDGPRTVPAPLPIGDQPLRKLLDFIDRLAVDDRHYWRVPLVDAETAATDGPFAAEAAAEIVWESGGGRTPWKARLVGEEPWRVVDAAGLEALLAGMGVDVASFQRQLENSILTQAAFAEVVLDTARELLGGDAVTRGIAETRAFLGAIERAMQDLTAARSDDDEAAAPRQRSPLLRLVVNPEATSDDGRR